MANRRELVSLPACFRRACFRLPLPRVGVCGGGGGGGCCYPSCEDSKQSSCVLGECAGWQAEDCNYDCGA